MWHTRIPISHILRTFAGVMKKVLFTAALAAAALSAGAEGYQVNNFSARQEGMGHTGVAQELGAESVIFNPGALAFSTFTTEISAGVSAIIPTANATYQGHKYTTDNKVSTPFNVSAAWRVYDNLYAGLSLYTPYGSSINWGENWPGAVLNQSVDIKMFNLQPTISYRVLPNLSIGAGLMMAWGNVDLNKGLVTPGSLNTAMTAMGLPASMLFDGITPASVNLKGSARMAFGINAGALWRVNRQWNIGLGFRSQMTMTVRKGDARVSYANEVARTVLSERLDLINATNFSASLPAPYVITLGASYKPIPALTLALDIQYNGWSAYDRLDVEFDHLSDYDQHLTKNYHNSFTYHLGAQYTLTRRLDLRAGLMVDTSPADRNNYNPETPAQTRIEPTVGLSFRPLPSLSVDLAFMYVHGCGCDGATGRYEDFIAKNYPQIGLPAEGTFTADYSLHAFSPAIGISYRF